MHIKECPKGFKTKLSDIRSIPNTLKVEVNLVTNFIQEHIIGEGTQIRNRSRYSTKVTNCLKLACLKDPDLSRLHFQSIVAAKHDRVHDQTYPIRKERS